MTGRRAARTDGTSRAGDAGTVVLHVLEAVRGGTSRHVADLVDHTPGVTHHVAVPPPGRSGNEASGALYDHDAIGRMRRSGATVHLIAMNRAPWHPANVIAVTRVAALVRRIGADVVHGHSSVGGAIARPAGRAAGRPVVYTANGVAEGRLYEAAERILGRLTDRWVAVSPSEARQAAAGGMVRPERIVTIPNGIDLGADLPPAGDLRSRLGLTPGTPLVGTVARLVPQKAPLEFVRLAAAVAARRPDAHFVLIGMGPLQEQVDSAVSASRLQDRWHQIAHLADAAAPLGQLDVFVLASRFEGGPYTPLDAMRAGVPVVLSDVVGNRDAVDDGISGFLRPFGDTARLAGAVTALLDDPDLGRRLTTAARERLADRFDLDKVGRRLADVYIELASPAAQS